MADAYELLNMISLLTWLFFHNIDVHENSMNARFMIIIAFICLSHGKSNSVCGCVVTATNTLQNFSYTWILEPTVHLVIGRSIVTSWSADAFKLPFWIGRVEVTCSHMLSLHQVHIIYAILEKHSTFHQEYASTMSNPC